MASVGPPLGVPAFVSAFGESLGEQVKLTSAPEIGPENVLDQLRAEGYEHFRRAHEPNWRMAVESACMSLSSADQQPDAVVYCSSTSGSEPGWQEFSDALELSKTPLIGVSSAGCGNVGMGFGLARSLVASGQASTVLLVTVDACRSTQRMAWGDAGVFSDGAASCVISADRTDSSWTLHSVHSACDWRLMSAGGATAMSWATAMLRGFRQSLRSTFPGVAPGVAKFEQLITNNYRRSMLEGMRAAARSEASALAVPTVSAVGHCYSADTLLNLARASQSSVEKPTTALVLSTGAHYWTSVRLERVPRPSPDLDASPMPAAAASSPDTGGG